jgi:predicted nucleic-acid-binding protein
VLQKVYAVNRQDIQRQPSSLLNERLVNMDRPAVFLKALECYGTSTLDFVDTLLWADSSVEQKEVLTCDKKLYEYIRQVD